MTALLISYKAKIVTTRIPVITIAVAVICLLIYWAQEKNEKRYLRSAATYSTAEIAQVLKRA